MRWGVGQLADRPAVNREVGGSSPPAPVRVTRPRCRLWCRLGYAGLARTVRWRVAIAAGALMVLVAQRDPAYAIERVDWELLLFFGSLFVVMRGFEATGAVGWIDGRALAAVQEGHRWPAAGAASGVMVVLSNLISNVPAVLLWRNVVPHLPHAELLWRVVAMSATFAGNLLLIGSVANLIVLAKAEARGTRIGFGEYARVGVPVTLLTLAWGIAALVLIG